MVRVEGRDGRLDGGARGRRAGMILLRPGPVSAGSRLEAFLRDDVLTGVLGLRPMHPRFRLTSLGEGPVLRCDEESTGVRLALKSYALKWIDGRQGDDGDGDGHGDGDTGEDRKGLRPRLMCREWDNILRVRALGLNRPPCRAVRPLAAQPELGSLLVEEFVAGPDLAAFVRDAARQPADGRRLDERLTELAAFLAALHHASATGRSVCDREPLAYLDKVSAQLRAWGILRPGQYERLQELRMAWAQSSTLRGGPEVLVHGDATPTQFLFPDGGGLVVVDFERLHPADPAADVGRVAAELKHLMTQVNGDPLSSEPHIAHFYREYHRGFPGSGDLPALAERARFEMACSQLRIARNFWERWEHRQWLVGEAMRCLA